MELVRKTDIFNEKFAAARQIIDREKSFPENVFAELFREFIFLQSDDIFFAECFAAIQKFLIEIGETKFNFAVFEPDPADYFYAKFGAYPLFEITVNDSFEEYNSFLQKDPGGSPFDALQYITSEILLYSNYGRWAIYVNCEFELAVFGTPEKAVMTQFKSTYGSNNYLFDAAEAVEGILKMVFANREFPVEIKKALIENY